MKSEKQNDATILTSGNSTQLDKRLGTQLSHWMSLPRGAERH